MDGAMHLRQRLLPCRSCLGFGKRWPVEARGHLLQSSSADAFLDEPVPGFYVIHQFPNGMRAVEWFRCGLCRADAFQYLCERIAMPSFAFVCALQLVHDELLPLGHPGLDGLESIVQAFSLVVISTRLLATPSTAFCARASLSEPSSLKAS